MLLLGLRQGTWWPEAYHGALPADMARFTESKFCMPKRVVVVAPEQLLKVWEWFPNRPSSPKLETKHSLARGAEIA
jgi:hypothetical protein